METEEVIKLVDGIYKNILEKFNPGARQLISAGKAYLKALHGAASASRIFNEALVKIASNAQQGGTTDIGSALMSIVNVYKEIQDQHMNILKAYFVDFLNPLESNLERDIKVVQFEQKKFLQQHKIRADSYSKAAATMKKHRKKKNNAEKEIKSMQALDEEKNKLDTFCEYSLKNAMTQERRRYGFVLERQCSIAKHWMAYHTAGLSAIEGNMENWTDVASTREFLHENMFVHQIRDHEEESERGSIVSQLRKTRSIDASCLDMRSLADIGNGSMHMQMPRAKSEYNLTTSPQEPSNWDRPVVKALYAYLSSGENQLSFLEDDKLALVGDRAKGWQFGENLRTQKFGWFPVAYVEYEALDNDEMWPKMTNDQENYEDSQTETNLNDSNNTLTPKTNSVYQQDDKSPIRMFGDTIQYRSSKQMKRETRSDKPPKPGLPPTLPAPVVPAYNKIISSSQSFSSTNEQRIPTENMRKPGAATINFSKPSVNNQNPSRNGIANASLQSCVYSSNDSGFSNEQPPPQPEIDYSDEDTVASRVPIRSTRSEKNLSTSGMMEDQIDENDEVYGTLPKRPLPPHMRQANSFGNLVDDVNSIDFQYLKDKNNVKSVKRNKSFWKFNSSKDDNIFQFAMWKHKDLVETPSERIELEEKEATLKRNMKNKSKKVFEGRSQYVSSDTDTIKKARPHSIAVSADVNHSISQKSYQLTKSDIDKRISGLNKETSEYQKGGKGNSPINTTSRSNTLVKNTERQKSKSMERPVFDDKDFYDEDLYDETPRRRNDIKPKSLQNSGQPKYSAQKIYNEKVEAVQGNYDEFSLQDTNFYDDDEQDMKAVKRKEILKQYYSSGTDTERNSSSSDPYDCILVEDHLVRNNLKNGRESQGNPAKSNAKRSNRNDDEKLEFSTFRANKNGQIGDGDQAETLLPRTKLSKTNSSGPIMDAVMKFETEQEAREVSKKKTTSKSVKSGLHKSSSRTIEQQNSQSYGPWYDLWANDSIISGK